ncbi:ABC transporter ATP-binding protein [Clostridium sporogenes]|uniref:ABC transporter ATP-binding protein n=1 Tax=Clostridium botulinum TaxID=1491 RepID=UPI0007179632|nr:ABC transporter ATP-binding protein [Clostridium botulinum]KRU26797.1 ABC transporter ATP-binding protein [Clostridium sporogenes]KRU29661.1 ABC transporter ATP-binding protein [Clostridium sporogenes]KRU35426.1 ABC transporter ATP-binding protein [Clostridium sporogenes]KRU49651.1 ABC transporter ATP-binding protein [Clostridium sporogenes]MBZ1328452.1 ABC transporter ATP-binding protein [Clostridium botulinum]
MELKIENLYKSYRKKEALKNINITMESGTYGLLGENGAGKSTLMRILTTVDFQTKGKVTFDGEDIINLDEKYRDIIGYMPQDYNVFPSFTAKDFLEYMGALKGIPKYELDKKIPEVLKFVNLDHVADKKVKSFSGGMKRRVGIAQAILNDPKILIFDEPTAGLDPKERIRFSNIISAMSKDKIVILSTHILSDIEAIANDLIIIRKGELVEADNIDNLVEKVRGKVWETVVDQDIFNKISQERKVIHRKQERQSIRVRYAGDEYEGATNKQMEPSLEDYYVATCL